MAPEEQHGEQSEFIPSWRKRLEQRREVVCAYMHTIDDDRLFLVAFLLMRGLETREIAKALRVEEGEVEAAKGRIALGLQLKGVELRK
jgi:hypothetical protein